MTQPPNRSIGIRIVARGGGVVDGIYAGGAQMRGFNEGVVIETDTGGTVRNVTVPQFIEAATSSDVEQALMMEELARLINELKRTEQEPDQVDARRVIEQVAAGELPTEQGLKAAKGVKAWISDGIRAVGANLVAAYIKGQLGI